MPARARSQSRGRAVSKADVTPTRRSSRARKIKKFDSDSEEEKTPARPTPTRRRASKSPAAPRQKSAERSVTRRASSAGSKSPQRAAAKPTTPARKASAAKKTASASAAAAEHEVEYEFFGPIGAAVIMATLPVVVAGLHVYCNADACPLIPDLTTAWPSLASMFDAKAFAVVAGWWALHAILYIVLPCNEAEGVLLADGKTRLRYKINALPAFIASLVVFGELGMYDILPWTYAYHNFLQLLVASTVLSWVLSIYLYARALPRTEGLADGGHTGNHVYDFFIGRELNPRIWGDFDLKFFCELRPGMIGWFVLLVSFAVAQAEKHGEVSWSMVFVVAVQGWYIIDSLWNEAAVLTIMDITEDGFGWMLAYGDLVFVPFTFATQARFLVDHPDTLTPALLVLVLGLQIAGFAIFRLANNEKNAFRQDPSSVPHLKSMPTKRGTRLLISGWWGTARHINYTGDLMMGFAWCLITGFNSIVPYFYAIYFTVMLVHRERRDDAKCREKYGADWDKYCKLVPSRMVPGIY